ncbi:MAG: phytanoyl-CoA dioxygenase family protein, partial [Gammaproteobacteria bacterium]|nr:phytanoyl-CoA dioxygenase family protein [Gammaproteobacteria bacterium]
MPAVDAIAHDLDAVLKDIEALRLTNHVAELDSFGLTVIPPEQAGPPGLAERLRDAVLRMAERRYGVAPDVATGASHAKLPATAGQAGEAWMWRILFEDPVFEEALMNPVGLTLMTYLLGYSAKLSNSSAMIKGPVPPAGSNDPPKPLGLHSDNRGLPAPFPSFAQVAAVTWALTDYTLEIGAVGYLPGSHKLCRQPTPNECLDAVVPVEAAAGSLIVWHGNTWHAPFPRRAPGLRMSM